MRQMVEKSTALAMDGVMCALMNALQYRRRMVCSREDLETYLATHVDVHREDFYRIAPATSPSEIDGWIHWHSPVPSGFPENDRPRARFFPSLSGPGAPTVLLLHALMSASDIGYRRIARWFNDRGWNAVFPHLPFHYSRKPRGYFNGELAISADLIRNGETLRQGVTELRQLLGILRARGCREFGLLGTSYGGWTGALLSFLEKDFRFLALIQPIVNVEHAIWGNPGSASMRRLLRTQGIHPGASQSHAHLTSPLDGIPACGPERAILTGGLYDSVARIEDIRELHARWTGSRLLEVRQGHFGHVAMSHTLAAVEPVL